MRDRITIIIKDNSDETYMKQIFVYLETEKINVLKNYNSDQYDTVWDRLCDHISMTYRLPDDWYIDHIDF